MAMQDSVLVQGTGPDTVALGNLRGSDAAQLVASASVLATTLAQIINDRGLYKRIGSKDHVFAEGWTTAAALCGLMPREVACERDESGAHVAVVSLVRIMDGVELSRASAECGGEGVQNLAFLGDDARWLCGYARRGDGGSGARTARARPEAASAREAGRFAAHDRGH